MKLKNARIGMRVKSKHGLKDEGTIAKIDYQTGKITVAFYYQDSSREFSDCLPSELTVVPVTRCEKCGRPL